MRILALVLAITFAASIGGIAVMWPVHAMKLSTTEPVVWQILLAVAGSSNIFAPRCELLPPGFDRLSRFIGHVVDLATECVQ